MNVFGKTILSHFERKSTYYAQMFYSSIEKKNDVSKYGFLKDRLIIDS